MKNAPAAARGMTKHAPAAERGMTQHAPAAQRVVSAGRRSLGLSGQLPSLVASTRHASSPRRREGVDSRRLDAANKTTNCV